MFLGSVKKKLMSEFRMTCLGPWSEFLGITIERNEQGLFLSQSAYLEKLLKKFNMSDCAPSFIP